MKVPFLDLSVNDPQIKRELLDAVDAVLTHGRISLGPEVGQFESAVAEASQKRFAVGVNSGTDALYFALRCLGIGPGDEVITTSLSWIATANAIALCGGTPVFVDIESDLNMDPERFAEAITPNTKAVLPVHFTGKMSNIARIMEIADQHGIIVVEDAAQSFGASINGQKAGSFGLVNCFSMNPMKVLNAYGEAGAVVTDDEGLYDKLNSLRYAGTINKQDCFTPSFNGRLDTIQAAMLMVSLKHFDNKIARRRAVADFYSNALGEVVRCPQEEPGGFNVYYTYTLVADRRDELREFLDAKGVETQIQHPILMPYHTAYKEMPQPDIPVAEDLVQRIVCIPAHENMQPDQLEYVAGCIREYYGE